MQLFAVIVPGLLRLRHDKQAQDLIEYAMLAAFMAMVIAAVLPETAGAISGLLSQAGSALASAAGIGGTSTGSSSGI